MILLDIISVCFVIWLVCQLTIAERRLKKIGINPEICQPSSGVSLLWVVCAIYLIGRVIQKIIA